MKRPMITAGLLALSLTLASCTGDTANEPTTTTTTLPPRTTTTTQATTTTEATATTTSAAPASPAFEPADCEFTPATNRAVECGWVNVPEDRGDPDGDTIRLHVAIFESDDPDPAPDPVVYLEGGPGGDALETLELIFEERFAHVLADRDLIVFDQRGTGFSQPSLACPELRQLGFDVIDQEIPDDELAELQLDTVIACRDRLLANGVNLAAYHSAANAADLADLRLALGVDEWNLYGSSYGTRLALTTMRDHPDGIRSVVLDSAYPPSADIVAEAPTNLDRALNELFDGCADDTACAAAYPDLASTFYGLVQDLEVEPIRAQVTDLLTGTLYDAVFDGSALLGIVFQSLYAADAIPSLPKMIADIIDGETYALSILTSSFLVNGEFVSAGMGLSVQCHEEAVFSSPELVADAMEDHPELEPVFNTASNVGPLLFDICAAWGAGTAPPLENEAVASSIPTLVLAGEYDPITPPRWGRDVAATLDAATFVEFPGQGHGSSATARCPQDLVRAFLAAPEGGLDTSCVSQMGPPEFVTPDTPVPEVTLVPYTEVTFGSSWSGVAPEGWEQQGPGVWARQLTGLDQTVVLQQRAAGTPAAFLVGLLAPQFGLGEDPQPAEEYPSPIGAWSVYEGAIIGAPVSLAVLEVNGDSLLVALVSAPDEHERLREEVFFPALDAFALE